MNWETKITIYKFTPQVFTLTQKNSISTNIFVQKCIVELYLII